MNRIIIVGRLTAKPELRTTSSGVPYSRFSIACDRPFQGQDKERVTDFINVVAWRQQANFITSYLDKGSQVYVEGRLQSSSYTDKDGNKRTSMEVMSDTIRGLESRAQASARQSMGDSNSFNFNEPTNDVDISNDPYAEYGDSVSIDENFLD